MRWRGANFRSCSAATARALRFRPTISQRARDALAATATWVGEDLDLVMRVALVPVAAIRAQGLDVRVARFGPSANLSYAMFSGGGLGWADAAMKRGEFAVTPAPPGTQPDLTGLSCRFEEIPSARGVILSVLVVPARDADPHAFRKVIEDVIALVERSPDAGRPVPPGGPPLRWPPAGHRIRGARDARRPAVDAPRGCARLTLFAYVVMRFGIKVGGFVPKTYVRQVVENSDFRKYDDGLRMILDCTAELERALTQRLAEAAASGIVRYGLHRQDAAMMTCFTPSAMRSRPRALHRRRARRLRYGCDRAEGDGVAKAGSHHGRPQRSIRPCRGARLMSNTNGAITSKRMRPSGWSHQTSPSNGSQPRAR